MKMPAKLYPCLVFAASLMLAACNDDDDKTGSASTTITGTAATGAPMSGADIQLLCLNNGSANTTANALGNFTVRVPTVNLPCAISATPAGGGQSYFSLTSGSGSVTTNVSPLTSLALALAGTTPDSTWFAGLDNTELQALAAALNAVVSSLNTALSGYSLPANFNPFSSPLKAATSGQAGNDYDRLLEQLQAALDDASQSFDILLASASAGEALTLPTPPRTPGVTSLEAFFTTFAGDYTLQVTNVASEGASAGAAALFPLNSARGVSIKANGDVSFAAVGRTITYTAADYNQDFMGNASTLNEVRYRTKDGYQLLELYISYNPATGELQLDASGFLANDEGLATLKGPVFIPASPEPVPTCSSGDDKLVFTDGPADFCGFTRSASATNGMPHYFQFTSAAGTHGVTWVKFNLNSDDSAVESLVIENDDYAFGCGSGAQPACTGITISTGTYHRQFTLANTALDVIYGASAPITVNGLLVHPVTPSGGGDTDGTLAALIGAAHAGTYVLSCPVAGGGSANSTVVINADGSSTVDGVVVAGSTVGADMFVDSNRYLTVNSSISPLGFQLFFNEDGTLKATALGHRVNDTWGCSAVSGARTVAVDPVAAIAGFARSTQLHCTYGYGPGTSVTPTNPEGSTAFVIGSDGTITLSELQLSPAIYNDTTPTWYLGDDATYGLRRLEVSDTGIQATELWLMVELNADDTIREVHYRNKGHYGYCSLPAP